MQAGLFYARLHAGPVAKELAPVTTDIYLTPRDPIVGAGLPAMTPCQPTAISLTPHHPNVGAGLLAKAAWQATQLDCVHIHCCGNGRLGFRPDGGSLWKSPKVTKGLLPHHSAPRLGSVCPNTGLNPWAAATRHPWRGAANPASCRVTHGFKPVFGQRGLTGRLRSRSQADQERLASHRGYRWLSQAALMAFL